MMGLLILIACIWGAAEGNELDCYEVKSTVNSALKVVLGNGTLSHVCSSPPHVIGFESMMSQCSEFCGSKAISFLVGTTGAGFNLEDMDGLCVAGTGGLVKYEPDVMANCVKAKDSLDRINFRTADFIASSRQLTYSQQLYKAEMIDKIETLQAAMLSDDTQNQMTLKVRQLKVQLLKEILEENLDEIRRTSTDLEANLDILQRKADMLTNTIEDQLPQVDYFIDNCNRMLLGTGPRNEYLLDICSVDSNECIESEYASHAGCCCGVIPAAGVFSIPAGSSGRRLQEEQAGRRLQQDETSDICGKAYELSQSGVYSTVRQTLETTEGKRILDEFDTAQQSKYSDFYADCDSRRLMEDAPDHDNEVTKEDVSEANGEAPRDLQGLYLTCDPPAQPSNRSAGTLKVAFTQTTEGALCKDNPGMTNDRMAQICKDFCAPTGVPFLLGALPYGFNQEEMDEICLQPDENFYSKAFVDKCHDQGNAFAKLQRKTASLAAAAELLEAAKLVFEAKAVETGENLKQLLRERAEDTVENARSSQKLAKLAELVSTGLADFTGGSGASREIVVKAKAVRDAAKALNQTFAEVIPDVREFMANCNTLMTGVGSEDEYLLDMCSQTSRDCLEDDEGRHIGCCCGYNPVVSFGTDAGAGSTIAGISAELQNTFHSSKSRIRVGTRRLQAQIGAASSVNICGEAASLSKSGIEQYKQEVDAIDPNMWASHAEAKKAKYPLYYNRCEASTVIPAPPTKPPTPRPAPVTPAPTAPTDTPTPLPPGMTFAPTPPPTATPTPAPTAPTDAPTPLPPGMTFAPTPPPTTDPTPAQTDPTPATTPTDSTPASPTVATKTAAASKANGRGSAVVLMVSCLVAVAAEGK